MDDNSDRLRSPAQRSMTRAVAACTTVCPHKLASIRRSANSGCHCRVQTSWKVPREDRPTFATAPQGTSSRFSRCSRWLRARSLALRKSRSKVFWSASGLRRSVFCACSTSRCSGTVGTSGGTLPNRSPTTSASLMKCSTASSPPVSTVRVASCSSSRPGAGRSRSAASASARRAASIRCAEEQSRSRSRIRCATRASHPTARGCGLSWLLHKCSYQPGDRMPAP